MKINKNKKAPVKIRKNKRVTSLSSERKEHLKRGGVLFLKLSSIGFFFIIIGVSFIFMHDVLTQCDYFKVKKVSVSGNERVGEEEILRIAGVTEEMNILSLNIMVARKKLISHPWLKEVDIRRQIPDKIYITVKEHQPLAIIDIGSSFLINMEGQLIKKFKEGDPENLPVVSGLELNDIDRHHAGEKNLYSQVMNVLIRGNEKNTPIENSGIKTIQVDREMGLTVFTQEMTIKLGVNDFEKKYERLHDVLISKKTGAVVENISSIDLFKPNRVVITPEKRI